MSRLVLLEDECVLRQEIASFLSEAGYAVDAVSCIDEFDRVFEAGRHGIAILDLGLPDGDGLDLIERLRGEELQIGIIVVSARSATPSRVHGLGAGADHYLGKPLDLQELSAIVAALGRRLDTSCRAWTLNTALRHLVPPGGKPIQLTEQAYTVIKAIAGGNGKSVSRREIVDALGENYMHYDQRRIDTQLYQLRKTVLDASGLDVPIRTARGQGYQFTAEVSVRA